MPDPQLSLSHTQRVSFAVLTLPGLPPGAPSCLPAPSLKTCPSFIIVCRHGQAPYSPTLVSSHWFFSRLPSFDLTPPRSAKELGLREAHPHPPGTGCSVHTSFQNPVLSASVIPAVADGFVSVWSLSLVGAQAFLPTHPHSPGLPSALSRSFRFAVFFLPRKPRSHH